MKQAYYAEMGLTPPPKGYQHYLNKETGEWELVPNNVPRIKVKKGVSAYSQLHQLTDAEYERYIALNRSRKNNETVARFLASGRHPDQILAYPPEVCEIAEDWYEALREKTYGPTFIATWTAYYDRPMTEAEEVNTRALMAAALKAAIPNPQRTLRPIDSVVEEILDEIEGILGITIERETAATKHSRRWVNRFINRPLPE